MINGRRAKVLNMCVLPYFVRIHANQRTHLSRLPFFVRNVVDKTIGLKCLYIYIVSLVKEKRGKQLPAAMVPVVPHG